MNEIVEFTSLIFFENFLLHINLAIESITIAESLSMQHALKTCGMHALVRVRSAPHTKVQNHEKALGESYSMPSLTLYLVRSFNVAVLQHLLIPRSACASRANFGISPASSFKTLFDIVQEYLVSIHYFCVT